LRSRKDAADPDARTMYGVPSDVSAETATATV